MERWTVHDSPPQPWVLPPSHPFSYIHITGLIREEHSSLGMTQTKGVKNPLASVALHFNGGSKQVTYGVCLSHTVEGYRIIDQLDK